MQKYQLSSYSLQVQHSQLLLRNYSYEIILSMKHAKDYFIETDVQYVKNKAHNVINY